MSYLWPPYNSYECYFHLFILVSENRNILFVFHSIDAPFKDGVKDVPSRLIKSKMRSKLLISKMSDFWLFLSEFRLRFLNFLLKLLAFWLIYWIFNYKKWLFHSRIRLYTSHTFNLLATPLVWCYEC